MTRPREVNWRREVIYPAQAMAEACLLAPWLMLFLAPVIELKPETVTMACLGVIVGTFYAARVMDALRIHAWIQRGLILIGIVSLTAVTLRALVLNVPLWAGQDWHAVLRHPSLLINLLPGGMLILLSVAWLFWRGLRMANQIVSVLDTMLGFQIGVVVLAVFAIVGSPRDLTIFATAFFFSELLSVGLTRVEAASLSSHGRRLPFSGWWMSVITSATLVVVVSAVVVTAIVLGVGLDKLFLWVAPVLAILAVPFLLILTPLMMLLAQVLTAILRGAGGLVNQLQSLAEQIGVRTNELSPMRSPIVQILLRLAGYILITLILVAVAYLVLAVVRQVGKRHGAHDERPGEQRESVFSARSFLLKMRQRLQHRLAQLRRLADIAGQFGAGGLFTALNIRRIYAQTVKLAAARGYPRPAARTPYEHLDALHQAFPGHDGDLAHITEAYVGIHYGELPERPEALDDIRAAFERIKAAETPGQVDRITG
jgi:hypothetical protein